MSKWRDLENPVRCVASAALAVAGVVVLIMGPTAELRLLGLAITISMSYFALIFRRNWREDQ